MTGLMTQIKITDHFVERYFERELNQPLSSSIMKNHKNRKSLSQKVFKDLESKINNRDRRHLLFYKDMKFAKVPFQNSQLILKNRSLITILN